MFQWIIGATLLTSTAGSAQAKPTARPAARVAAKAVAKSQSVCPISHEAFTPDAKRSAKYNGATVYFCCPGCKAEFARLSDAEKKAHLAQARKIETSKAKKHA